MVHVTAFSMWINRTQSSSTHIQAQRISHDQCQRAKLHRILVHWIWTVHWSSITNTFRITHKYTQLKHSFNTHFSRTTFLQCFDTVGWTPGRTYATKTDSWGLAWLSAWWRWCEVQTVCIWSGQSNCYHQNPMISWLVNILEWFYLSGTDLPRSAVTCANHLHLASDR